MGGGVSSGFQVASTAHWPNVGPDPSVGTESCPLNPPFSHQGQLLEGQQDFIVLLRLGPSWTSPGQ